MVFLKSTRLGDSKVSALDTYRWDYLWAHLSSHGSSPFLWLLSRLYLLELEAEKVLFLPASEGVSLTGFLVVPLQRLF